MITMESIGWSGRLEEPDFLDRIFDQANLPSTDRRFKDAARDIWQHRVNNPKTGRTTGLHGPPSI
jgi:hypothetical protein